MSRYTPVSQRQPLSVEEGAGRRLGGDTGYVPFLVALGVVALAVAIVAAVFGGLAWRATRLPTPPPPASAPAPPPSDGNFTLPPIFPGTERFGNTTCAASIISGVNGTILAGSTCIPYSNVVIPLGPGGDVGGTTSAPVLVNRTDAVYTGTLGNTSCQPRVNYLASGLAIVVDPCVVPVAGPGGDVTGSLDNLQLVSYGPPAGLACPAGYSVQNVQMDGKGRTVAAVCVADPIADCGDVLNVTVCPTLRTILNNTQAGCYVMPNYTFCFDGTGRLASVVANTYNLNSIYVPFGAAIASTTLTGTVLAPELAVQPGVTPGSYANSTCLPGGTITAYGTFSYTTCVSISGGGGTSVNLFVGSNGVGTALPDNTTLDIFLDASSTPTLNGLILTSNTADSLAVYGNSKQLQSLVLASGAVLMGAGAGTLPAGVTPTGTGGVTVSTSPSTFVIGLNPTLALANLSLSAVTPYGAAYFDGTGTLQSTVLSNGNLLIGRGSGATPVAGAITGDAYINVALGSGTIGLSMATQAGVTPGVFGANTSCLLTATVAAPGIITATSCLSIAGIFAPSSINSTFVGTGGIIIDQTTNTTLTFHLDTSYAATFSSMTLTGLTQPRVLVSGTGGLIQTVNLPNGNLLIGNGNAYTVAAPSGTTNRIIVTTGAGSLNFNAPQDLHTSANFQVNSMLASASASVAPVTTYTTGTASQSGGIVTGSGTTFTSAMAPGVIQWDSGSSAFVLAFISTTQLLVFPSQTVGSGTYKILAGGAHTAAGGVSIGKLFAQSGPASIGGYSVYNTGTAAQSGTVVTGTTTVFTAAMVGGTILWTGASGVTSATILSVDSGTSLFVSVSQTVADSKYVILYGSTHATNGILGNGGLMLTPGPFVTGLPFTYDTGTANQSGTTVIGIGTTFPTTVGGGIIYWPTLGQSSFILAYVSATQLTVSPPITVSPAAPFIIYFSGAGGIDGYWGVSILLLNGLVNTGKGVLVHDTTGLVDHVGMTVAGQFPLYGNAGSIAAGTITSTGGTITQTVGASTINLDVASNLQTNTLRGAAICAGSSYYTTGTASQSGTTITGAGGASFTTAMQGGAFFWTSSNAQAFVLSVTDSTHLTVDNSATVASGAYVLCYNGVQSATADLSVRGRLWLGSAQNYTAGTFGGLGRYLLVGPENSGSESTMPIFETYFQELTNGAPALQWGSLNSQVSFAQTGCHYTSTGQLTSNASPFKGCAGMDLAIVSNLMELHLWLVGAESGANNPVTQQPVITLKEIVTNFKAVLPLETASTALILDANGAITGVPIGNGQILVGSNSGAPAAASIGVNTNTLTMTGGANTITLGLAPTIQTSQAIFTDVATYSTGTAGTGGVSLTTITGSGTTWTSAMVGGEIAIAGVVRRIVTFTSTTSIQVTPALTVSAGTSYVIYYGGTQLGGSTTPGAAIQGNLILGIPQTITSGTGAYPALVPTSGMTIVGASGSNTGIAIVASGSATDIYPNIHLLGNAKGGNYILFDSYYTGSQFNYASSTFKAWRIKAANAAFSIETGTSPSAGNGVTWTTGLSISSTGITPGSGTSTLTTYDETTDSTTFTGPCTTASVTIAIVRIGSTVTLRIPAPATCSATSSTTFSATTGLSAGYRPAADICVPIPVANNGANTLGGILISSAGALTIYSDSWCISSFTNGANCGPGRSGVTGVVVTFPTT